MSLRDEVEYIPTPYRKPDGSWWVLRKIDRTTFIEKPATADEVENAIEAAQAVLLNLTAPMPKPKPEPVPEAEVKAKPKAKPVAKKAKHK